MGNLLVGVTSFMASSILCRLVSLFVQIFLGYYLSAQDYGVYGIVVSLSIFSACFQEGVLTKLLVQRQLATEELRSWGAGLAIIFAVASSILTLVMGGIYAIAREDAIFLYMSLIIVLATMIGAFSCVGRAMALIDKDYSRAARGDLLKGVIKDLGTIPCALLGMGAYTFVASSPVSRLGEFLSYKRLRWGDVKAAFAMSARQKMRSCVGDIKWLMFGAVCASIVLRGDYFVLSFLVSAQLIGLYFFGYQIVGVVSSLFSSSIVNVLMPELSSAHATGQKKRKLGNSIAVQQFVMFPLMCFGALIASLVVNWVWGGKWDRAAIVVTTLLCLVPLRQTVVLLRTYLEAKGAWRNSFGMLATNAIGVVVFSLFGGIIGTLEAVVGMVAIWQFIYCVVFILYFERASEQLEGIVKCSLKYVLFYGVLLVGCFWALHYFEGGVKVTALVAACYVLVVLAGALLVFKDHWAIVKNAVSHRN